MELLGGVLSWSGPDQAGGFPGRRGLRILLREEGVSFQRLKTWKTSRDPDYATKKARVEHLYAIADGEVLPEDDEPEVIFCMDPVWPARFRRSAGWSFAQTFAGRYLLPGERDSESERQVHQSRHVAQCCCATGRAASQRVTPCFRTACRWAHGARQGPVSVKVSRHAVTRTATAVLMRHAPAVASRRLRHALVRHFGEQYTESVLFRSGTDTRHIGQQPCPHRNSPLITSGL
ncbi:hypothetical protein ACGFWD_27015 [Streptomyces sp. NPDC048448]|uniref:hypothetical protein n=1 Tax=Streptomyces sp. NPDC048448 TaxID=3365554 RepID=UPI00371F6237